MLWCPQGFDCQAVMSSRFAVVMGIPLSWLGAGFYASMLAAMLVALALDSKIWRKRVQLAALWASFVGVSFSVGLMYLQFFVLRAFCSLCTVSAITVFALAWALVMAVRSDPVELRSSPMTAVSLGAFAVIALLGLAMSRPMSRNSEIVAEVDGRKILRREMEEDLRGQVWPLRMNIHRMESQWVRSKVETTLLKLEAEKRGLTVDQLIEQAAGPETAGPGRPEARQELLSKLMSERRVREFLPPVPSGPRAFDDEKATVIGPRDATVELVVFSDYTCKFCIELDAVLRRIRSEFPEIRFVHHDFPLDDDSVGFRAAVAARCASEQGAFWKFNDLLFDQKGKLPPETITALAQSAGLDLVRFSGCLKSEKSVSSARASRDEAMHTGIPGVPALFLNGTLIGGMVDYTTLRSKILEASEVGKAR